MHPGFFLFDNELALYYRGRYDESRPGNELPVNGNDLKNAVDRLLSGKTHRPRTNIRAWDATSNGSRETSLTTSRAKINPRARLAYSNYLLVITYTPSQSSPGGFSFITLQRSIKIMEGLSLTPGETPGLFGSNSFAFSNILRAPSQS